ncbi:unnamed protein product, partial [Meganyctiphanes norvegica]
VLLCLLMAVLGLHVPHTEAKKQKQAECGKRILLKKGQSISFVSPGYPSNYSIRTKCKWIFKVKEEVEMNCDVFDLSVSKMCSDSLSIIAGEERTKFCGSSGPSRLVITSQRVRVYFKSHRRTKTAPGFSCTIGPKTDEAMNDVKEVLQSPTANTVPCDKTGGQIQPQMCCPWWNHSPDDCTTYDACVCKDGFVGDECEHDCSNDICPADYKPVCGGTVNGEEVTFSNKCKFFVSKCNKEYEWLYFKYDGACHDHSTCPRYDCPMDVAVNYYDNPDHPGCKLCGVAHDSP